MRAAAILVCSMVIAAYAPAITADDALKAAITEQQQGDFEGAIRDYREALKLRPDMVEAKVNLGAALAHTGHFDEAIAMYKSALPSLSFKDPVILNLALAYYKKGDFAAAQAQFEKLHALQPNDTRATILLADTDLRVGKPAETLALLQPLDSTNSDNLDFQFIYGSALIGTGHRRDGAVRLEKVAQAQNRADAYLLAGVARLDVNDFELARSDLETALRLDPQLPNIYTLVGTARDKLDDPTAAEPAFRQALQIDPNNFEANLYLGAILYKRRDIDEARKYLDHALALRPTDPLARYESAMLKSTAGQYQAAAEQLEQVARENPNWLDPHVQLATLYYKLHKPEDGARERQIVERLTAEQQKRGPASKP
jgi:Tfp pilus assembly protein PilF